MKTFNTRIQKLLATSFGVGALMLPAVVNSAPGTLATQPLFASNAVKPNIILSLDDSGSMDWETLFNTDSGVLFWDDAADNFASGGTINFSGNSYAFAYLFPNDLGFSQGRRLYSSYHPVPPMPQYGYARSSSYNNSYYNPDVTYQPWVDYSGQTFGNIDPTNAPADPYSGRNTDKFDLTNKIRSNATFRSFVVLNGMTLTKGSVYDNGGTWTTAAADIPITGNAYLGFEYYPATYYKVTATGTYQVKNGATVINGDCSAPDSAHYEFFHDQPQDLKALGGSAVDALGPDGKCLEKVEITAGTDEMQNFANWFSYYRKRHLALRAGLSLSFDNITGVRSGQFTINNRNTVTMRDIDVDKDAIYANFYNFPINGGTPNRTALNYAGSQYKRTDSNAPVTAECQKNFTILFTDGYSNDTITSVGNADGNKGAPYADTYSNTLADIAMKYYTENIRTDLTPAGQVPPATGCDSATPDPALDCNTNLHMSTFTVGLGSKGTIFGQTHFNAADAYAAPPTWPNATGSSIEQIDDLYHAGVNGRGDLLNAQTPAELVDVLGLALKTITAQVGSSASVAFNTSVLSTGSVVYQARFNTKKWKGELLAFDLDPTTGNVAATASWDAGDNLPANTARVIYTYNPDVAGATTSKGVLFEAATSSDLSDTTLPAAAMADLQLNLPTTSGLSPELTAKDRLNYLRGDRSYEGVDTSGRSRFRERNEDTVLGDIVHSAPLFVGAAVLNWPTGDGSSGSFPSGVNSYETWKASVNRSSVVYVGANDGMLHGFDATTGTSGGTELMAYIPSSVYSSASGEGLHYLSEPTYQHHYYVDNTPSRTDAYVQGRNADGTASARAWRSVLVGTLRGGGKGVFALDVNNPASFGSDAASAARTALWEFTSQDDADLGFTFSRPTIVPTNATDGSGNIRWAAVFGNGYNNGGDCHAKLFVLFLDGGLDGTWTANSDYLELDTQMGTTGNCNGLSTPAVVDLDGDGKADAAYAGDLYGNMWNFDLCNKDNQGVCQGTGWDVAYSSGSGAGATPAPLFTATDVNGNSQPITATPIVISHPTVLSGGLAPNTLVLFGTGQYLVDGDKSNPAPPSHTYYGVWDRGDDSLTRAKLMQQVFETGFGAGADFRVTGLDIPDYTNSNANNRQYGWYLDLPDTSETDNSATGAPERVVTRSVVIGDIVFFNTLVPTVNGCDIGGYGYLMSVETKNGGRPDSSVIDVNGDGKIDDGDFQTIAGQNAAVVGKKTNDGILSEPSFLGDKRYESTSKGTIIKDNVDPTGLTNTGRFSWQEIRVE